MSAPGGYQCPECQQWHRTRDNLTMHRAWAHPEHREREIEQLIIRRAAAVVPGAPASAARALDAAQKALRTIREAQA